MVLDLGVPNHLVAIFGFSTTHFQQHLFGSATILITVLLVNLLVGFAPPGRPIGTPHWDEFWCREGRPEGAAMRVLRNEAGFHVRLEALHQCRG